MGVMFSITGCFKAYKTARFLEDFELAVWIVINSFSEVLLQ